MASAAWPTTRVLGSYLECFSCCSYLKAPAFTNTLSLQERLEAWHEGEGLLLLGESPEAQEEFIDAVIGVTWREGLPVVVYDREKVIQVYIDRDGMSREDAEEFYEFNVEGAYVGPQTPVYVDTEW